MTTPRTIALSVALTFAILSGAQAQLIFDPALDFSFINNPNSPRTFGYKTELGGNVTTYTDNTTINDVQY